MQNSKIATTDRSRHLARLITGLFAAFLLTVVCYWPSLSGPFLFDDIPNLELIGERGGLDSADKYLEFITSGRSGPLGRPLSLASFTLDGQTWPTDPRPFRITNLIIHLVNGVLLFLVSRAIFSTSHTRETADNLALLCTTLWLLHPLLVSTTAYVIQRMTQLSCLFTLTGLLCYIRGRNYLPKAPIRGWIWIVGGMGLSGALALLSKENGILLPFYALVLEVTIFSSIAINARNRNTLLALLCLPLIAVVAYLMLNWDNTLLGFELRPFALQERLLTQAVVLIDYLRQIGLPQLSGLGIIHDDYPLSRGLFDPVATVFSFLAITALLVVALRYRKRWPLVSLGILWFFAGHSLEAGPFALELYFEHRNYLPLLGPLIAISSLLPLWSPKLRRLLPLILILFISMESFLTWQAATTWGNEERFTQTALVEHPNSLRAQEYIANRYVFQRRYSDALATREVLAEKYPDHVPTKMSILNLRCVLDILTEEQIQTTLEFLERSGYHRETVGFLAPLTSNAASNTCSALGFAEVQELFDALLRSSFAFADENMRGALYYHKGVAYRTAGDLDKALEQLDLSYATNSEIDIRLIQIAWLFGADRVDDAERYLRLAQQHGNGHIWKSKTREAELEILQQRIDQTRRTE